MWALPSLVVMVQTSSQIFSLYSSGDSHCHFLTVLNAPSSFVNTCLSSSKPVCFARKGFFLYLYHTMKYCWVCAIHQHTKSIRERSEGERGKTHTHTLKQVEDTMSLVSVLISFSLLPPVFTQYLDQLRPKLHADRDINSNHMGLLLLWIMVGVWLCFLGLPLPRE